MTVTVEVRSQSSTLLATFVDPVPGPVSSTEFEVGSASVRWRPETALEPGVCSTLADGSGGLHTWDTADVELWVWRDAFLVHRGPIVTHVIHPVSGWVETSAHDCAGYLRRLDQGRGARVNWLPVGEFTFGLPGWSANGATITESYGSDAYSELGYGMKITGSGAPSATSTVFPAIDKVGVVHIAVTLKWTGATFVNDAPAAVGIVAHYTSPAGAGTWSLAGQAPIELSPSVQATNGAWLVGINAHQRTVDVDNYYVVAIAQPGTQTVVGEVKINQSENVSARSGTDPSTFAAALYDRLISRYDTLNNWTRSVAPTGWELSADLRSDDHDHPEIFELLRQLQGWGAWWVEQPDDDYPVLRYAFDRAVDSGLTFNKENASGLKLTIDGSEQTTEALFLADGQDGPTRDEGYYTYDPLPGALLMTTQMGSPGLIGRDLRGLAYEWADSGKGPPRELWALTPTEGPSPGDPPGKLLESFTIGEFCTVDVVVGVVNLSYGAVYLRSWTWDPVKDVVDLELKAPYL